MIFVDPTSNLLLFHGHVRQVRRYIVDFVPHDTSQGWINMEHLPDTVGEMSAENESSIES